MSDGAYRGDLEAAQARIAQLEDQLREAQHVATMSPALAAAEARHRAALERARRGPGISGFIPSAAIGAGMLPVIIIAATHGDALTATIFSVVLVLLAVGLARLVTWSAKRQGEVVVQQTAKELEEARRLQRLEDQVRDLSAERGHVRVASAEAPPPEAEEDDAALGEEPEARQMRR